ncbi:MAG: cation transporter [Nitrospirae bacterium]|nr:cation transporter [Nitrospirota bacterium]
MDYSLRSIGVRKVILITLGFNLLVGLTKIIYGMIVNSVAIMSDGIHTLFDGFNNIMGLVGIYYASRTPDEKHPYGYRKFETVLTIFIGVMMFFTAYTIFHRAFESFISNQPSTAGLEAFLVMLVTLSVNFFVSAYERKKGLELNSEFLVADAGYTRSDVYVTLGVIAGLILARLGFSKADPIVGMIVGFIVAWMGVTIFRNTIAILVDESVLDSHDIMERVCAIDGVESCHKIRSRGPEGNVFIDLHVQVDPLISVNDGHEIANVVKKDLKTKISGVVDVVVHIEPVTKPEDKP